MATLKCSTCGAEQDSAERFCSECQAYLWWDHTEQATVDSFGGTAHLDGTRPDPQLGSSVPGTGGGALTLELPPPPPPLPSHPQDGHSPTAGEQPVATEPAPAAPAGERSTPTSPAVRHAAVPEVAIETSEVTIGVDGTGTLMLGITNPSDIVDGYDVTIPDAPPWLVATAEDAHLMPGESRKIGVMLSVRSEEIVLAQRIGVRVEVVSQADGSRRADAAVDLLVPPAGPLMSLLARPSILRLQDVAAGRFVLVLDNRSSNHPQTFDLSASDPEGVVRFGFDRRRVTVRPGGAEEVNVEFTAPLPQPGEEVTRQVTITGAHPEGAVTATLLVIQRSSQEAVDEPLRLVLSPAHLSSVNGADADFEVQLDNRRGESPKSVVLSARDAENRLTFAFTPRQITVPSGVIAGAAARVRSTPPPAGTTDMLPFTVVASTGQVDSEAQGQLEVTATPDPMSTALLHVSSPLVRLGSAERGVFDVVVDNRDGYDILRVWLTGTSDDGEALLTFDPGDVSVPARSMTRVRVRVKAPRPRAGESLTRDVEVRASDGRRAISAATRIAQDTPDLRPAWSRLFVIFGAIFAVIGSLMTWVGTTAVLPSVALFQQEIAKHVSLVDWNSVVEAAARVIVILLAVLMVLGLTGRAGGLTRESAIIVVLLTAGLLIGTLVRGDEFRPPALGLFVVWFGALLGYIGGVLARPRQDR